MPRFGIVFLMLMSSAVLIPVVSVAQPDKGLSVQDRNSIETNWYPHSHALVVGVDKYSNGWPRLQAAVSDAEKMTAALTEQGFEVVTLLDEQATRENILKHLRDTFRMKSGKDDRFVFYFSGHGQDIESPRTREKVGYLIPVDGKIEEGGHSLSTYISMEEVKNSLLDLYHSRHILVIADSCFSGLLATRSGSRLSASVLAHLAKQAVNLITAGERDQVAQDGLFTSVLIRGLEGEADRNNDGYITFDELGGYVEDAVSAHSNGKQVPFHGYLSGGQGQMVFEIPRRWAHLSFAGTPKEKVKLEIVDPAGERTLAEGLYGNRRALPGKWTVKASAEGYESQERTVEAVAGEEVEWSFELKKLGVLYLVGEPEGAKVMLSGPSGELKGELPLEAGILKSGEYKLTVESPGYSRHEEVVRIEAGKEDRIHVTLVKIRKAQIVVTGSPEGASVFLEGPSGQHKGSLPFSMENIEAGRYELKVVQEGYQEQKITVAVSEGEEEHVEVDLEEMRITITGGEERLRPDSGFRITLSVADGVLLQDSGTERTHVSSEVCAGYRLDPLVFEVGSKWFWESPMHVFVQPALLLFPLEELYVRAGMPLRVYDKFDYGAALGLGTRVGFPGFGLFADLSGMVLSGSGFSQSVVELRVGVELEF